MNILFHCVVLAAFVVPSHPSFLDNPLSSLKDVGNVKDESKSKQIENVQNAMALAQKLRNAMPGAMTGLSSILVHGEPLFNNPQYTIQKPGVFKKNFNWTSCGPANQVIEIKQLSIKPSPISLPGTISFAFDIVFNDDVDAKDNVTATLTVSMKAGEAWIKFPCIGMIGSCTYKDLCSLLNGVACPKDLTKQGIKCHCPWTKGEYKLQPYSVTIDANVLPAGDYKLKAEIKSNKGNLACYEVMFASSD